MFDMELAGRRRAALRYLLWWSVGLSLLALALISGPTAWADSVICSGQSSIPITPTLLKIVRGVEVTYGVGLCSTPTANVTVTAILSPAGKVTVTPGTLVFPTPLTQTMGVALADGIDTSVPFTVEIRHSTASADPDYNWGTTNVPSVIAVYRPPLARNDIAATISGQGVAINVRANDLDRSGTGLTVMNITQPAEGVAEINPDQSVTFTPTGTFTGTSTFMYTVADGDGNYDDGEIIVTVSSASGGQPVVQPVNPSEPNSAVFTQTVVLPTGPVSVTTQVYMLSGTFPFELSPHDILVLGFSPVITPTGPVDSPPTGADGQADLELPWQYANLTFDLWAMLNAVRLDGLQLAKPMFLTVGYDQRLLHGLDERTLMPYYWTGTEWSNAAITIVVHDVEKNEIIFLIDAIVGELSFFARQPTLTIHFPFVARDQSMPPWGANADDDEPPVADRRSP
jgi:hypothetical protein